MKEKHFKKWKETRKKGKTHFIIFSGVIGYGLPMFFVMCFVVNKPFINGFTASNVASQVSIWLVAGLSFGFIMWHGMEYMYSKVK